MPKYRLIANLIPLSLLALSAPVFLGMLIGVRAFRREIDVDFAIRPFRPALPTTGSMRNARTVTFRSANGDLLSAWWLPGNRRLPIILIHGSDAARDQLLPEAEILSEASYPVLLLDLPGHGESGGKIQWGQSERLAISAAVSFACAQASSDQVAVYAFSSGAFVAAQIAATDARVRAAILAGPTADFVKHIMGVFSKWGWLSSYPAIWGAYFAGYRNDGPTTVEAISRVGTVLVITGTADPIVTPAESLKVFEAAREPKELLRIDGAHHGDYLQTLGRDAYARALTTFLERYLGQQTAEHPAPIPQSH